MKTQTLLEKVKKQFKKKSDFAYSVENETCQYYTKNGKRCAIGRQLPVKEAKKLENLYCGTIMETIMNIEEDSAWKSFPNLKKIYDKYGMADLSDAQYWHDDIATCKYKLCK